MSKKAQAKKAKGKAKKKEDDKPIGFDPQNDDDNEEVFILFRTKILKHSENKLN